jgi:hypothetical protein
VLQIVQRYIRERVDFNGLHPCEVGLQTYAQRIIGLLIAAITPDDRQGEAALLPRLNRYKPIDSTGRVRFKTVKPVQITGASHLNFVACDTNSWEQAATFQLEKLAKEGIVFCYARNDRLEFNIPYELYGNPQVYEPDFIVRLTHSLNVVLEIKGKPLEDTDAKHQAAKRWVAAVNHWGRLVKGIFWCAGNRNAWRKPWPASSPRGVNVFVPSPLPWRVLRINTQSLGQSPQVYRCKQSKPFGLSIPGQVSMPWRRSVVVLAELSAYLPAGPSIDRRRLAARSRCRHVRHSLPPASLQASKPSPGKWRCGHSARATE